MDWSSHHCTSAVQSHLLSSCPFSFSPQPICPPLQLSSEPVHNKMVSCPLPPPFPPSQFLPICPNQQYTVVQNSFLLHLLLDLAQWEFCFFRIYLTIYGLHLWALFWLRSSSYVCVALLLITQMVLISHMREVSKSTRSHPCRSCIYLTSFLTWF